MKKDKIMQINNQTNITNITPIQQPHFKGIERVSKSIKPDTFIHSPDYIIENLDRCITKAIQTNSFDLIQRCNLSKQLKEAMPVIARSKNLINKGRESKVYRINDNYVAKITRGKDPLKAISVMDIPMRPDKHFTQLSCYYGEPVLKIGDVKILKNAVPNGVSMECGTKFHYSKAPSAAEIERYNNEYLPLCESVPQSSYDELALCLKQMNNIRRLGVAGTYPYEKSYVPKMVSFTPDVINPNNLLISDGKFRIVDKLDKTDVKEPNTFYTLVEPLIVRYSPEYYAGTDEKLFRTRQNILKKCILASEKANLSFKENSLTDTCSDYIITQITNDQQSNITGIIPILETMRANNASLDERLKTIVDYFKPRN